MTDMTKIVAYLTITALVFITWGTAKACNQKSKKITEQIDTITTATSPSRDYIATVYVVSGGGAGGYVYKVVNLRRKGERFDAKKDIIFSATGTDAVTLSWESDSHLLIRHSKLGNIYVQAKEWARDMRVRIRYLEE